MTYKQWYQEYLRLYKRKLAEKTQESYTRLNALISPIIGTKELEAITPDDIQTAIISAEKTAGSRQAQLVYTLLHAAFRRAVRSGHIRQSPVEAVDKPDHEGKQGRAIEGADWQLLAPIIRESVAFSLACFAGLRRGEVLGLRRGDIDLEAGLIRIERQRVRVRGQLVTAPPKSSAGVRIVPISPELAPILTKAVRCFRPPSRSNLARNTGRRWNTAQKRRASKRRIASDLRHTYATRLVLEGINLRVLQYVIGHADYQLTVSTYTHIGAAAAKIELSRVYNSLH
ncbi:MAG: tyrosine-type recombinase/integrase [Christensenellales bacterium]